MKAMRIPVITVLALVPLAVACADEKTPLDKAYEACALHELVPTSGSGTITIGSSFTVLSSGTIGATAPADMRHGHAAQWPLFDAGYEKCNQVWINWNLDRLKQEADKTATDKALIEDAAK